MRSRNPARVTVVMPMRNAGPFLAEAMRSILTQFERDLTFLIIDDGSTDDSVAIAESLADERTEIVRDGLQLGIAARLNSGLDHATTRYVARMDADDIAAPHRLKMQLAFMDKHPAVGICGSWRKMFRTGHEPEPSWLPVTHDQLRPMTLFAAPFVHPSVVFNMSLIDAARLRYANDVPHAEDYDLWERAGERTLFANVPQYLLYYRLHQNQVSTIHAARQRRAADIVRRRALSRLGVDPTPEEFELHSDYGHHDWIGSADRLRALRAWLRKLAQIAESRGDMDVATDCAQRAQALRKGIRSQARLESRGLTGRLRRLVVTGRGRSAMRP